MPIAIGTTEDENEASLEHRLQSTRGRVRESIFGINSTDPKPKFKTEAFGDLDLVLSICPLAFRIDSRHRDNPEKGLQM